MSKSEISKRELKAQRVKDLFIETTKNIIIEQGIKEVSARKVADEAGYTFATIYNHFKNMDELLFATRSKIIAELISVLQNTANNSKNIIYDVFKCYIDYLVNNTNIFELLFYVKLNKQHTNFEKNVDYALLSEMFINSFKQLNYREELLDVCNTIFFSIHGMLMIYISGNFNMQKEELFLHLNKTLKLFKLEVNNA